MSNSSIIIHICTFSLFLSLSHSLSFSHTLSLTLRALSDDDISNAKKELEQETREDLDEDGEDEDCKYFL